MIIPRVHAPGGERPLNEARLAGADAHRFDGDALREHNVARISSIYRSAFAEIRNASDTLKQAFERLEQYFAA